VIAYRVKLALRCPGCGDSIALDAMTPSIVCPACSRGAALDEMEVRRATPAQPWNGVYSAGERPYLDAVLSYDARGRCQFVASRARRNFTTRSRTSSGSSIIGQWPQRGSTCVSASK